MIKRLCSVLSTFLLLVCFTLGMVACNDGKDKADPAPDYSKYDFQFEFFGHSAPNAGKWWIDDIEYSLGKDYRTVEEYQRYKDVGMTEVLLGNSVIPHRASSKEDFLEQNLAALTAANEVGFNSIIMCDYRYTNNLAKVEGGLVGEGKRFATEKDLDDYLTRCISWYKDIPGINAVSVGDEPSWNSLESFGQLYQALKRVWPEAKKFYNFFPMNINSNFEKTIGPIDQSDGQSHLEAVKVQYERYLKKALSYIDEDDRYLRFDVYPFKTNGVEPYSIVALQVAANVCKELNIKLYTYAQSCEMTNGNSRIYRKITENDARWMNNLNLGFGTNGIGYFTYRTSSENSSSGESFMDGSSFITWRYEKTEIYDFMQKIMAEDQKFASTILNFDYQGCKTYIKDNSSFPHSYVNNVDNSYEFKALKSVSIDKECAIATELYDSDNNHYMYMFMNAINPINKGSKAYQTSEIKFDTSYKNVVVYKNGEGTPQRLRNNSITVELAAGEAVFLLPY